MGLTDPVPHGRILRVEKGADDMESEDAAKMDDLARSHAALKADDLLRLRSLSMRERSALLESACETAAIIVRSRIAAGLPRCEPAPGRPPLGSS